MSNILIEVDKINFKLVQVYNYLSGEMCCEISMLLSLVIIIDPA